MDNIEKFKGKTEGVILFVLMSGQRHTDDIKSIIDDKFFPIKIGTLYSQLTKMKDSGLIKEYRASSLDGSRRKFYSLTEKGHKLFNGSYAELFGDVEPVPRDEKDSFAFNDVLKKLPKKPQKPVSVKPDNTLNAENGYENAIKDGFSDEPDDSETKRELPSRSDRENDYSSLISAVPDVNEREEIDFSALLNDFDKKNAENADLNRAVNEKDSPLFSRSDSYSVIPDTEDRTDYDSFISSEYEYSGLLNKMFPKKSENYEKPEPPAPQRKIEEPQSKSSDGEWNDVYELSQKEGIKIRTSQDTNRYRGSKIQINKLRFFTSLIALAAVLIEYLLLCLIFINKTQFSPRTIVTLAVIFGIPLLVTTVAYALNPSETVKNLPRLINVMEIALILAITVVIISFAILAIKGVQYNDFGAIFNGLVVPLIAALNLPASLLCEYALSKLDFFQLI